MKTAGFWRKNWLLGLAVAVVPFFADLSQNLERKGYDLGVRATDRTPSNHEPAPDILQFNPKLPPALVAFLDRARAKETEARFQTGDALAKALRASASTWKSQVEITI